MEEKDTVLWPPETVPPTVAEQPSSQSLPKPVPAAKAVRKPGRSIPWIAGCLAGACLLFSVAGVALLASNWQNLSFLNRVTEAPPPTQTVVSIAPTDVPLPTAEVNFTGNILLEDDFSVSRDRWGTLTSADSSLEYENEALRMRVFTEEFVAWSTPNDQDYENIHMEVTAFNNSTDPTAAFGLICAQQLQDWSFYYLAITPAGEYAIIRATDGESDFFLTNNGQWASSDLIAPNAASYRVAGDCGHGTLTLYVDGQQIASVSDSTYTAGRVGLFTWSGSEPNSADVTFDDFLLRALD